ncbi:MAG: hypothetical protein MJE12_15645 [Alphaproteobacteria bacterium]|nr:hypothetical protein [Alphaproteobacteria bacterium]
MSFWERFERFDKLEWVEVSEREVRLHPEYGVGWCTFFFIGFHLFFAGRVGYWYTENTVEWSFGSGSIDAQLSSMGAIFDGIWIFLSIALCILLLIRFLYFMECVIALYVFWFFEEIFFAFFEYWLTVKSGLPAELMAFMNPRQILAPIVVGGFWVQYVYASRRINATILHRILKEDLPLVRGTVTQTERVAT